MGWVRCAVIAKQDMKDNILGNYSDLSLMTRRVHPIWY